MKRGYKLKSMAAFRKESPCFADPKPSANTLRHWVDEGILQGERIGKQYYVHVDEDGWPVSLGEAQPQEQIAQTGNQLADALLHDWSGENHGKEKAIQR